MLASSFKNCFKSSQNLMIKINKEIFKKAFLAGIFSAFTIGVLTVLTYKSALGLFIAGSFGSSMVLLFGFPESPFAQPKNVFFWTFNYCTRRCNFCSLNTAPHVRQYSFSSRSWNFLNDSSKCCSSSCRWKSNNGDYWKRFI